MIIMNIFCKVLPLKNRGVSGEKMEKIYWRIDGYWTFDWKVPKNKLLHMVCSLVRAYYMGEVIAKIYALM